jgi:transcriptional regulator with XRE-family HTH domain
MALMIDLTSMRVKQHKAIPAELLVQAEKIGLALARLRVARNVTQEVAAIRAGISRNSAWRMEHGDPGVALGQILRYLDAIAPGATLLSLLAEDDPALTALALKERRQRAHGLTKAELQEIDF